MAAILAEDSVIFTDTSTENIEYAKQFWRAIDKKFDEKSRLFVSGIDHRLQTVSQSNKKQSNTGKILQNEIPNDEELGLMNNRDEARRRLQVQEQESVHAVLDQKKQQQDLLKKRREERLAKEGVRESSKRTLVEELSVFDVEDEKDILDDEGVQAMKDIDDFERMVKMSNEWRKENT